ncbi:MAG: hypothetical protein QME81_16870 [bacterium]|nr:hypothetical protein [bacterium]
MRRFFKGLLGVGLFGLGGSSGEETVINVLAGHEGQRRAKWGTVPFGLALFLGLGLCLGLAAVRAPDVMSGKWTVSDPI